MARLAPILVTETTAAALLDMRPAEFRLLVEAGHLPRPREIAPGFFRYDAEQLRCVGQGEAVDGMGDVTW